MVGFGLSSDSDKSIKDEEQTPEVTGSHAGSGLPGLATTINTNKYVSQALEENLSSEDENDNAFSFTSEFPYQGQGNSLPEGAIKPNSQN